MKTVDIKGKAYVEVNERLIHFRENFKNHSLVSTLLSNENGVCIFKAEVFDENEKLVATGHAYEKEGSTFINKTSYIENCETSAWGRALGNFGIGIDTAVASADEVQTAIANQDAVVYINNNQVSRIYDMIDSTNSDMEKFLKYVGVDAVESIHADRFNEIMAVLNKKSKK